MSKFFKNTNVMALMGAALLMATSSVGPGFMTQTAKFTQDFGVNFAFVITVSIIISYIAQLNIWRIITMSNLRGQDIANKIFPGLGYFLAVLIALGGLAFNIGNVGGASIGLNILTGLDTSIAAGIAGIFGIFLFIFKRAKTLMDISANIFGAVMIILIGYVAFTTDPPVAAATKAAVLPTQVSILAIITLVGGTVGGYITFSGGHRLIDAGIHGKENLSHVNMSATLGIAVDFFVRVLLFLAILGVVNKGFVLDPKDPAGSAFGYAGGDVGHMIFGLVFFIAAMTSVIGAAYTSVSFLKTLFKPIGKYENLSIIAFIAISTLTLIFIGKPAKLLVLAGSLNGLILPIALGAMLFAVNKKDIMKDYAHPIYLTVLGWIVVALTAYLGFQSLGSLSKLWG